jgi:predicted acyltransferase (DUF342 family)
MTLRQTSLALPLALALLVPATASAADGDISKVNGAIQVDADNRNVGNLDTVNGSITIGARAVTGDAETVNGSIKVDDDARVGDLSTVNGSIRAGRNVQVNDDVETVNGQVFIDRGGVVRGNVSTVNGAVGVVGTQIHGNIDMVAGNLTVGADSHVHGGIHYQKSKPQWISIRKHDPRVVIGPNAQVDGPLVFERKVTLHVHDSARIGTVTGATAVKYSGTQVPAGD